MKNKQCLSVWLFLVLFFFVPLHAESVNHNQDFDFKKFHKDINWKLFRTIPVQYKGRVMPYDSFARVMLLQLSGMSTIETQPKEMSVFERIMTRVKRQKSYTKLTATQWLTQVVFEDDRAKEYPTFLIENPEVAQALNIPTKKDRDRYSYNALYAKLHVMQRLADEAQKREKERNENEDLKNDSDAAQIFDKQILQLHYNVMIFHSLLNSFSFLREQQSAIDQNLPKLGDYKTISMYMNHIFMSAKELFPRKQETGVQEQIRALENTLQQLDDKLVRYQYNDVLAMFPPVKADEEVRDPQQENIENLWKSPWFVFYRKYADEDSRKDTLWKMGKVYEFYHQQNWEQLNRYMEQASGEFKQISQEQQIASQLSMEVSYNRFDFFFYGLIFYILSTILCSLSWLRIKGKGIYWAAFVMLIFAYILHTSGLTMRIIIKQRPPVSTLYESVLFVSWVCVSLCIFLEYFSKKSKSFSLFVGSLTGNILLFIASKYAYEGDNFAVLVAVLDSNFWLSTHVTSMTIGYSACLVAGGIGHVFILANMYPNLSLHKKKEISRMIYGTVCFGTLIAFIGTILGGLWADDSWGRFWGWDPKENGALLIVLWNAFLLHARMGGYIKDWGMALGAVFGNIIVAAAWWGVNLLSIGLHNYGFTEGLYDNLKLFALIEIGFIVLGMVFWYFEKMNKTSEVANTKPVTEAT